MVRPAPASRREFPSRSGRSSCRKSIGFSTISSLAGGQPTPPLTSNRLLISSSASEASAAGHESLALRARARVGIDVGVGVGAKTFSNICLTSPGSLPSRARARGNRVALPPRRLTPSGTTARSKQPSTIVPIRPTTLAIAGIEAPVFARRLRRLPKLVWYVGNPTPFHASTWIVGRTAHG